MINLFIGSTVRCGGSLLARLFDHHPDVAAYPFELHLPMDESLHPSLANRGERSHIQNYPTLRAEMTPDEVLQAILLHPDPARCLVGAHFRGGRLRSKARHLRIPAEFDHARFLARLRDAVQHDRSIGHVYDKLHESFFATWDQGKHGGSMRCVAYHRANGLLADVGQFFREFEGGFFIQPVRSIQGCLASEKRKVLSQLVSGRVSRGIRPSDRWVKYCYGRFAENTIVNWLVTMTRSVILKEHFGDQYLVYRFEDLARDPDATLRGIIGRLGLDFDESLTRPTQAGHDWAGNSMFGRQEGINADMAETRDLLNETEKELVDRYAAPIVDHLEGFRGRLVDYESLDRALLFDYDLQSRYFDDREKTALYFASLYERWAFRSIGNRTVAALSRRPKPFYL